MPIRCEIVTQERLVYSDDVDIVVLPGTEGRMGILPNHSPLLTALDFGAVTVRKAGHEEFFAIGGGFAEVQPDHVFILADSAEHADEIDVDRAARAREEAERMMKEGVSGDPEHYARIEQQLRKAQIRLSVGRQHGRRRAGLSGMRIEEDTE
jgi:F-type H+-transporting ATPase subunit epsilon